MFNQLRNVTFAGGRAASRQTRTGLNVSAMCRSFHAARSRGAKRPGASSRAESYTDEEMNAAKSEFKRSWRDRFKDPGVREQAMRVITGTAAVTLLLRMIHMRSLHNEHVDSLNRDLRRVHEQQALRTDYVLAELERRLPQLDVTAAVQRDIVEVAKTILNEPIPDSFKVAHANTDESAAALIGDGSDDDNVRL